MRKDSTVALMTNGEFRVKCASDKLRRASIAAAVAAANHSLNKKVSFSEGRRRRMSHAVGPLNRSTSVTDEQRNEADVLKKNDETTMMLEPAPTVTLRTPTVQRAQSSREPTADATTSVANRKSSSSFQCTKRSSSFHESVLRRGENYQVLMLGAVGVGKSSLVRQASRAEHVRIKVSNVYGDTICSRQANDAHLVILDNPAMDITAEMALSCCDVDAYVIVYSVTDRDSFRTAQRILKGISCQENFSKKAAILVGNKVDLVRKRVVSTEEGKACATERECKFIETSDWIDYNVDELFEGVLTQIRLRLGSGSGSSRSGSKGKRERRNYRRSKTLGAKSWGMLKDLINKINRKVKSCDDLHVL